MMHLCNLIVRKSQTQHTEAKIGEDPDLHGIHTREPWSAAKLREQSCSDCNGQMCCLPSKVMPWCRDANQAGTQKQHFRALTRRHGTVAPFLLSPGTSQYPPPDESLASRRRPWLLSSSKLGKPSTDLANLVTHDMLIPNCSKRTSKKQKNSLLFVCWNVTTFLRPGSIAGLPPAAAASCTLVQFFPSREIVAPAASRLSTASWCPFSTAMRRTDCISFQNWSDDLTSRRTRSVFFSMVPEILDACLPHTG